MSASSFDHLLTCLALSLLAWGCDANACIRHSDCPSPLICANTVCAMPPSEAGVDFEDAGTPGDSSASRPDSSRTPDAETPDASADDAGSTPDAAVDGGPDTTDAGADAMDDAAADATVDATGDGG